MTAKKKAKRRTRREVRVTYDSAFAPCGKPWKVTTSGGVVHRFRTKVEAVWLGRLDASTEEGYSLVICGRNGRIQEERSYGNESPEPG